MEAFELSNLLEEPFEFPTVEGRLTEPDLVVSVDDGLHQCSFVDITCGEPFRVFSGCSMGRTRISSL